MQSSRTTKLVQLTAVLLLTVLWFLGSAFLTPCLAQTTTGELLGTLKSASGKPLSGQSVTLTNLDRQESRQTTTSATGDFSFTLLAPGNYGLRITASGYKSYSVPQIALRAGDRATVLAMVTKGSADAVVSGTAVISSGAQSEIAGKAVQDVPENQRNYVNLAQIQAGANEGSNAGAANGDSNRPGAQHMTSVISVNGQPDSLNQHLIDGADNNERLQGYSLIHPSVEIIASVQVKTSGLTADLGRTSGGALLVSTRSGTNKFHGDLFEYLRNDMFDASPFQFGAHNKKPEVRQNQFGGSLGGPVFKNKTYFFADYEGFRLIQGAMPQSVVVPTLYEHQNPGDFTDIGGAKLTAAQIDPVGLKYFDLYPLPNVGSNEYSGAGTGYNFSHTADVRIDHKFDPRDSIFARFSFNKVSAFTPGQLPDVKIDGMILSPGGNTSAFPGGLAVTAYNPQISFSRVLTHHLGLNLMAAYTSYDNMQTPLSYGTTPNATWGQAGININTRTSGLSPIVVTSGVGVGNADYSYPYPDHNNVYQYKAILNWTHNTHNIKFGAGLINRQVRGTQDANGAGYWTFATYQTLLQGVFTSVVRNYALVSQHFSTSEPSVFVTDTWRLSKTLVVDAGLRWDAYTPYREHNNYLSTFDPSTGTILVASQNGVSNTVNMKTTLTNFGPRLGVNWQAPMGFAVNASAGIGYYMSNMKSKSMLVNMPYAYGYGPCSSSTCAAGYTAFQNGLPVPVAPNMSNPTGSLASAVDPNWKPSYNMFFNINAQRTIKGNRITLGWVGSPSRHMGQMLPDINAPAPNTAANANPLRPYYAKLPGVTTISFYQAEGVSSYNALQAVLAHRMQHGLSFSFNYTWAHGLDDGTGVTNPATTTTGFGTVPSLIGKNVQGRRFDYGNSNMDVRHRVASNITYELPFGKSSKGIRGMVIKNWQVNAVEAWATGIPYTIANASSVSNTLVGQANSERPNLIGNPNLASPGVARYFNVNAFQAQQKGTIGQLVGSGSAVGSFGPYQEAKNSLHGPHNRKLDVSLAKTFPLDKAKLYSLQFQVQGFNLTNTSNFAPPNHSLVMSSDGVTPSTANGFGSLKTTTANYTPRDLQFVLKLMF